MNLETTLNKYNYEYPKELVALAPTHPRDSAKLLVFNRKTKQTSMDIFKNLGNYLPKNAVLVLNQTKVIPARFTVTKPTGGKAVMLYVSHDKHTMTALSDRLLEKGWKLILQTQTNYPLSGAYAESKGSHAKSQGTPLTSSGSKYAFIVLGQHDQYYILKPSFPISKLYPVLEQYGKTPIPPYIKHSPLSESKLRSEYQTVFAKTKGSVAAPTASLHLTKSLLNRLKKQGIQVEYVTLHVNLGTFATLTEENIKTGRLHKEYYEISPSVARRLNQAKQQGKPIIAVGTTVVRTLESATITNPSFRPSEPCERAEKSHTVRNEHIVRSLDKARDDNMWFLPKLSGETDLFIQEHYQYKFVDGIITNFHVPKSSLLMLVSAFTRRQKLLELYALAIQNKFRLFSFGDGMMIL